MIVKNCHLRLQAMGMLALATALLGTATAQQPANTLRNLSGTVTDRSHEPLSGAVVELQNPANSSVESYITDATGHYAFLRLDGATDYRLWATFRGRRSHSRSISKFDSHMQKFINLTIRSY
jgi:hypothetical protein